MKYFNITKNFMVNRMFFKEPVYNQSREKSNSGKGWDGENGIPKRKVGKTAKATCFANAKLLPFKKISGFEKTFHK